MRQPMRRDLRESDRKNTAVEELSFTLSVHSAPQGEADAAPSPCEDERVVCRRGAGEILIAVLDGCGGTGGKKYAQAENWTGARLASHLAGRALYRWFSEGAENADPQAGASGRARVLAAALDEALTAYNGDLQASSHVRSFISSKLSKDLPTTLAAMTAAPHPAGGVRIRSYWAGNSRNYALIPSGGNDAGLKQLSRDDIVGGYDPYEDLLKDGILCNSVNASEPFEIHTAQCRSNGPCILFSASDGIFGYLDSPIRLEWILLDTLERASSPLEWERMLRESFASYAADDHTLQLAALGFSDFAGDKAAYAPRRRELEERWIRPLEEANRRGDHEAARALWESYKTEYLILDGGHGENG